MSKIAFLGLGTMGYPMAGHLSRAGYQVCVYNRNPAKAEAWLKDYPGTSQKTPRSAVADADIIISCVGNDNDLRDVYLGAEGVLAGARSGSIIVDHTTVSAEVSVEIAEQALSQGIQFLDAPVSGGQVGAEQGQLTIMAGGDLNCFNQLKPLLGSYAKALNHFGSVGSGQTCKMVNQVMICGVLQGLSEGLQLAEKSGLDIQKVVDTLKHGAAGSWQLENRAINMVNNKFDYGFAVDWMRKDLAICLKHAQSLGINLPLVNQVDQRYAQLQQRGYQQADTSVLYRQFFPE